MVLFRCVTWLGATHCEKSAMFADYLPLSPVPALHAEIQVAGCCESLDKIVLTIEQPVDYLGRPSADVLIKPILITFTGRGVVQPFFTQWAMDHYMRRSGYLVAYEHEQTRWRLAFYEAWCVVYNETFEPGKHTAAHQLTLALSPAAIDLNGIHVERHTDLWWEKEAATRFKALTKPADPLPSPSLRAQPIPISLPIALAPVAPPPAPPTAPIQSSVPATPPPPSQASKNKRKKLLGPQPTKDKSKRLQYLGRTPGKSSATGRDVQKRMVTEGKLRDNQSTGTQEVLGPDGNWYTIDKTDMGHLHDAVNWWNTVGRKHGPKAPEVRRWMLDSKNYELEPSSINRSRGAQLTETYLPPLK